MLSLLLFLVQGGAFDDASVGNPARSTGITDTQLTLDFNPGDTTLPPSVARLDTQLCFLNAAATANTCLSPTWRYSLNATDATASAIAPWSYGPGLNIAGSGTAPTLASSAHAYDSPLLGPSSVDGAVLFNAGKAYQAASASDGDVTTQDLIYQGFIQFAGAAGVLLEKKNSAGYTIDATSTVVRAILTDGTHSATVSTGTLVAGAWYFVQFWGDKSGSGQWYVNNATSGTAVDLSAVGSLTNSGKFTLGADSSLANGYGARVAYSALYVGASVLPSHLNDTVAKTEFSKLTRTLATCRGNCLPLGDTHDVGYLRKYNGSTTTTLFKMGAGWPRVEKNNVTQGLLNERLPRNLLTQSEDISTTWTMLDAGDTFSLNSATMTLPVLSTDVSFNKGDGFIPDNSNGDHGGTAPAILTLTQDTTFSVFVTPGDHNCIYLSDDTAPADAYFSNLAACASCVADGYTNCTAVVGTSTALGAYARNFGNGVCRVDIQAPGTVATHTMRWQVCDSSGDKTIQGDGSTVALYVWGFQTSHYADYSDQYIRTAGASVSNTSGSLVFDGSDNFNSTQDSIVCEWARPYVNDNTTDYEYVMEISNGTVANFIGYGVSETDTSQLDVTASSVSAVNIIDTVTTFIAGQQVFTQAGRFALNDYAVFLDGVSKGTDTSGTFPTMSQIVIGGGVNASGVTTGHVFYGHIKRCRIFNALGRTTN